MILCSGPVLHTACIIERDKMNIYKLNVLFKNGEKKKAISLKERLGAEKKIYKNTARPLEHNSFCGCVCA